MCEQNIACANQLEFSIRHGHRFDIYIEIETRRLWNCSALLKCKPQFSKLTHLPRICRGLTSIRRILRFDNLFTIHIQNEETLCMELQQAQQSCQIRINPISCQRVIDDSLRSILGTGDLALISFHPQQHPSSLTITMYTSRTLKSTFKVLEYLHRCHHIYLHRST